MVKHLGRSKVTPISEGVRRGAVTGGLTECGGFRKGPLTRSWSDREKASSGAQETEMEE